ncbi:glycoside hydrolase family 3 protein [bacterium]|nr:glycoside hydrolase family 3 protein [bacterium]
MRNLPGNFLILECRFGKTDEEKLLELAKKIKPVGWIFFEAEIESLQNVIKKILQTSKATPLFCYDLERGFKPNLQVRFNFPEIPSQLALANFSSLEETEDFAFELAKVGKFAGLNTIFAPVLDVNSCNKNPIINLRSFGEKPQKTADFGRAFTKGIQKAGLVATGKHFPGHGNTELDSHTGTVASFSDQKTFDEVDLLPFSEAVKEKIGMIMTAHVSFPKLNENLPATLSEKMLKEILRKKLGFEGLVVTDAFSMAGIGNKDNSELAVDSILAGSDCVLMPENPEKVMEILQAKFVDKTLSEEQISLNFKRIKFLKDNFSSFNNPLEFEQNPNFSTYGLEQKIRGFWRKVTSKIQLTESILLQTNDTEKDVFYLQKFIEKQGYYSSKVELSDASTNLLFAKNDFGKFISVEKLQSLDLKNLFGIGLVQIRMNKGTTVLNEKQIELWNSFCGSDYLLFGSANSSEFLKGRVVCTYDFSETCQKNVMEEIFKTMF